VVPAKLSRIRVIVIDSLWIGLSHLKQQQEIAWSSSNATAIGIEVVFGSVEAAV
jgi:hypothetical protein